MRLRTAALASVVIALIVAACGGGSDESDFEPTAIRIATSTPIEEASASIVIVGPEKLTIPEYLRRLVELNDQTSITTNELRVRVDSGTMDVQGATSADFANIGDLVIGLYALKPPDEMFANHERRVQSLMGYVVAFQDRKHQLEERSERDTEVCQETERLAANHGITIDLECRLGDW